MTTDTQRARKRRLCPTDKRENDFKPFDCVGRFMVCNEGKDSQGKTVWLLVDNLDSSIVSFEAKRSAAQAATFARDYVRTHGDIDLQSFPYAYDQRLRYAEYQSHECRDRVWYFDNGNSLPPDTKDGFIHHAKDFKR